MNTFTVYWDNKLGKVVFLDKTPGAGKSAGHDGKVLFLTSSIKVNYAKQRELISQGWVQI